MKLGGRKVSESSLHEGPFPGEPREVEAEELSFQVVVKRDEFAVSPRAEMPTRHVNVEHLE